MTLAVLRPASGEIDIPPLRKKLTKNNLHLNSLFTRKAEKFRSLYSTSLVQ
jgi:hypothetical protein